MSELSKRRVLIFAGSGIGGTEKCATLFAENLVRRGHQVGYVSLPGPRAERLERNGVEILLPSDEPKEIAEMIRNFQAEIVHQHVPGYPCGNPIYAALNLLADPKIKLIETNVFGRLEDPIGMERVDFRMFISFASAVQAFRRASKQISLESIGNQMVVGYPVPVTTAQENESEREAFRRELGVCEDEVLFYRIGQAGHKWTLWEFDAFQRIKKKIPKARLLLMQPPANLWEKIEPEASRLGVILRKTTSDFAWLEKLNLYADIAIHASAWGESFGYTIAEAMMTGRPLITRSTPWGDNAQVELVANGKTGFVCLTTGEMARRGIDLARDMELRRSMGWAGRSRIQQLANQEAETDALEAVMDYVMTGEHSSLISDRHQELIRFSRTFTQNEYGFSERLTEHPFEKGNGLLFLLYKNLRGKIRTYLSKNGCYKG
jgi:glycosyltransferase involved in cell wall biosynthesis